MRKFPLILAFVGMFAGGATLKAQSSAWAARHGLTSAAYSSAFDDMKNQGYRPVQVSGYAVGNQDRYAAIWEKRSGPAWAARHGLTSAEYSRAFDDLVSQGYRLVQVSGYAVGGQERYAAIWEKRAEPAWAARHGLTSAEYSQVFNQMKAKGYRPVQVSGYAIGNQDRYAAIWEKDP